MKPRNMLLILVLSILMLSCSTRDSNEARTALAPAPVAEQVVAKEGFLDARMERASLLNADQSQSVAEALDRKIISSAELALEVTSPAETQQRISSIAAAVGGFVVTSEAKQTESTNVDPSKQQLSVMLVVRVPAAQFDTAISQIRGTGGRVVQEKISGQDVTEEFIDLEARLKTQKALELQFLEIMKQATKVEDAMAVQRQIADVRSDIERLEGRKRFLANRASLSTITVNLRMPTAIIVNTSSFGRGVREAIAGSVELTSDIVLGAVRLVILLVPIAVFFGLPAALLARYFVRRSKRLHLASELELPAD